jgi:hypothetical protein
LVRIVGISPEAKPITTSRPRQASARKGGLEYHSTEGIEDDVGAEPVVDLLSQAVAQILPRQVDHEVGAGR